MKKNKKNQNSFEYLTFLKDISDQKLQDILFTLNTDDQIGMSAEQVIINRKIYGSNILSNTIRKNSWQTLLNFFINPFNLILLLILSISLLKKVFGDWDQNDIATIISIMFIFLFTNFINLFQEVKSSRVVEKLKKFIYTTVHVLRDNKIYKIFSDQLVIGDIVLLNEGHIVSADIKLIETNAFFVQEASLTGEAYVVEKDALNQKKFKNILENKRLLFMGTNVISGFAKGVVIGVGENTYLGYINKNIDSQKIISEFQKGIKSISKLLMGFIIFLVPLIFIINCFKNKSALVESLLFSLTIAFGLTPEMLPFIITTSLTIGLFILSKNHICVKNLNSIQDFGVMNILFTDKTGTLTEGYISLDSYLDLEYNMSLEVLEYAYLNSFFSINKKNIIDDAIINKMENFKSFDNDFTKNFRKISEIPFDYNRRKVSVILAKNNYRQMITKGAIEEILHICDYIEIQGKVLSLGYKHKQEILDYIMKYNRKGFRVLGVSKKDIVVNFDNDNLVTENQMVFVGFLTFFDLIKTSSKKTINSLQKYGIDVKILTGDNATLTSTVAECLDINNKMLLSGLDIDKLSDHDLYQKSKEISIFVKLSPEQKRRIVSVFQKQNHIVGFMGDGINDVAVMKKANLSIAVNSSADITKEAADVIFLENDLSILQIGIIEGRKIYTNMLKYLKFTLASNLGNVLSVLVASFWLPFIPMEPIQILFLNLVYDVTCGFISYDNVDSHYLKTHCKWNFNNIKVFMFFFGFVSFLCDLLFFGLISTKINCVNPTTCQKQLFQTSWFIFSMWTQVFMIYLLRTDDILKGSKPSLYMMISSLLGILIVTFAPFVPFLHHSLLLSDLSIFLNSDWSFYLFFISVFIFYLFLIMIVKKVFIFKYKRLL